MKSHLPGKIRDFFANSDCLDRMSLRPLSHIAPNWETEWDHERGRYLPETHSFAEDLNVVIELLTLCRRPRKYHDHEDSLAEEVIREHKWPIQKKRGRWVGADYHFILEQGAFRDLRQRDLIAAAAGRVHAALDHGQQHFDHMEEGHLNMLSGLIATTIYHRHRDGSSLLTEDVDGEYEG